MKQNPSAGAQPTDGDVRMSPQAAGVSVPMRRQAGTYGIIQDQQLRFHKPLEQWAMKREDGLWNRYLRSFAAATEWLLSSIPLRIWTVIEDPRMFWTGGKLERDMVPWQVCAYGWWSKSKTQRTVLVGCLRCGCRALELTALSVPSWGGGPRRQGGAQRGPRSCAALQSASPTRNGWSAGPGNLAASVPSPCGHPGKHHLALLAKNGTWGAGW